MEWQSKGRKIVCDIGEEQNIAPQYFNWKNKEVNKKPNVCMQCI